MTVRFSREQLRQVINALTAQRVDDMLTRGAETNKAVSEESALSVCRRALDAFMRRSDS